MCVSLPRTSLLAGGKMVCPRRASQGLDIPTSQSYSRTLDYVYIPDKGIHENILQMKLACAKGLFNILPSFILFFVQVVLALFSVISIRIVALNHQTLEFYT